MACRHSPSCHRRDVERGGWGQWGHGGDISGDSINQIKLNTNANESPALISTKSIIIATGSRYNIPNIPGIDLKEVLTSDQLLSLIQIPKNILILGGGPEGAEFASILSTLGCEVIIVELLENLLPSEDKDVGSQLSKIFEKQTNPINKNHSTI